jgi:hypothetical protein
MQVDDHLFGDGDRNLWARVIGGAKDDLSRSENQKWSSGREREAAKNSAINFFDLYRTSRLPAICFHLGLDLNATVAMAHKLYSGELKTLVLINIRAIIGPKKNGEKVPVL